MDTVFEVANSVLGRFFLLSLLLGGLTQGLKSLAAPPGSLLRAVLMAVPTLWGLFFGLIPGMFPGVDTPLSALFGGGAGVLCVYAFDFATQIGGRLRSYGLFKADEKLGGKPPPANQTGG